FGIVANSVSFAITEFGLHLGYNTKVQH
ncbi:hypothetical protein PENANT_c202G04122, partial [Penicillium antarcticum]